MTHPVRSAIALLLAAAGAHAAPFTIPINPTQSSVSVQLCVQGQCGSDSSPTSGYFTIDVDDVDAISSITAYDVRVALNEPLNLVVNFSILGRLTVNINNYVIYGATPGSPVGPFPVAAGAFSVANVPTLQSGTFDYTATGIVCSLLSGQTPPIPCTGNGDLSTIPQSATTLNGTITSASRVVSIVSTINQSGPIDPTNPGLGTLTVTGTLRGSLLVPVPPCTGDINLDGVINTADLTAMLGSFGTAVPPGTSGDITGDGVVNTADLVVLLGVFGTTCADH